jgi:short subunit dehydrogenase-like uncharacterized protein
MKMKKFDIVLFGATGFTGKFIAYELANIFLNENFTWAIAGRSQVKLNSLLTSIDQDLSGMVDTLIVDVNDRQSILEMCQKAKIIINCVGPVSLKTVHSIMDDFFCAYERRVCVHCKASGLIAEERKFGFTSWCLTFAQGTG